MALPILSTPIYELNIPSSKETIKFRPFLVKEEKALMIAQQSENTSTMLNTIKEIIKGCTFNKVDVEKLATFDIEYIFLNLRAKSVGEISELTFSCKNCNDEKAKVKVNIDLTKLNVKFDEKHMKNIELFNDVGIIMRYPSLQTTKKIQDSNNVENIFDLIISCIESIYDKDSVYSAVDQSKEELSEFINNLTQQQFQKIQEFFETMPKLEHEIQFDCPVCGFHHTHTLKGLENFF